MLPNYSRAPIENTRQSSEASQTHRYMESQTRVSLRSGGYYAEVECVRQAEWDNIIQAFDDSSLMQTWTYGSVRWGEKNLTHVVLRKDGKIVAASQGVILKVPLLPIGLAYVRWGPCWQIKGQPRNLVTFRQMLRVLYQIYAVERGLLLQIFPNAVEDRTQTIRAILEEEGFQKDPYGTPRRTVLVDLSYSLDELRQSLKKRWRHNLVLAEMNRLKITSGVDVSSFRELMLLYHEMKMRKSSEPIPKVTYFERVQADIAPPFKMMCMICRHNGVPVSGVAVSKIGNTAVLLLAATGNRGLTLHSSYLLQWEVLKWLKSSNVRWYDLFCINRDVHPGTYQFKSGIGGKLGSEVDYVGAYHAGNRHVTRVLLQAGEKGREILFGLRHALGTLHIVG